MTMNPQPLVSDDMNLFTLMLRIKVRMETESPATLAWVLPDLLMRCQSGIDEPGEVLQLIERLARTSPELGRRALLDALEREIDAGILEGLVKLLGTLGTDLGEREADALQRLGDRRPGERVHAMYLLCALGPNSTAGCQAVLELDLGRLWRLEQARVEALARQARLALPACIVGLAHEDETVRARAEAALEAMGPRAATATAALLEMPTWDEEFDRASPALFAIGEAALPALQQGLQHASERVRSRASQVLQALEAAEPQAQA